MSEDVIRVDGLGKHYRIGKRERYRTLRDTLVEALRSPVRRLASAVAGTAGEIGGSADDHVWALEDVNFQVARGEVVGIIGRNGAGKTTLLKILSRITEPTRGRVEIRGRVGSLLEVGTGFHPELTGRENLYLNGAILGMKRSEIARKFDEIVAFAEVEKFIDTPVKHYSSGMYVRLAFAVAAHLEPDILLVDEVLAVGDAAFQKKCLGRIGDVAREGRTVLLVSHNMASVTSICQRGLLLAGGRLTFDDIVEKTVGQYLATIRPQEVPSDGIISLVGHFGRRKKHDGRVVLTYCKLLDTHQQPVTYFSSGKEATIAIGYEMVAPVDSSRAVFAVHLDERMHGTVFGCSNEMLGYEFNNLGEAGEVQCTIPKLPLRPGNYVINIGCKVGGTWCDFVHDVISIDVVTGDFYPAGLQSSEGWGNVLVEHRWRETPW